MNMQEEWENQPSNPQLEGFDPDTAAKEKLPEDYETPAAPVIDKDNTVPLDHPVFDSKGNMDTHEAYDAGETTASGANAQNESAA